MATIKPFIALKPAKGWFESLQDDLGRLQGLLELGEHAEIRHSGLQKHVRFFDSLMSSGNYTSGRSAGIYVYEQQTLKGSQFGIWAQTSLKDLHRGDVVQHEQTIEENLQRLTIYRKQVGLEGNPVLLTYPRESGISRLIEQVASRCETSSIHHGGITHRLWEVTDVAELDRFICAFADIPKVYVADGHHRLAAAASTSAEGNNWITSLYVSSGQLRCSPFHRLIIPEKSISKKTLLTALNAYYHIIQLPSYANLRPQKEGRLGLCHQGIWYQLDLKQTQTDPIYQADVNFLQSMVLAPFFGITEPRADQRLSCWADEEWDALMGCLDHDPTAILFTMPPLTAEKLMHLAGQGVVLPPKSTYMEPKVPYGLMLYRNKEGVMYA